MVAAAAFVVSVALFVALGGHLDWLGLLMMAATCAFIAFLGSAIINLRRRDGDSSPGG